MWVWIRRHMPTAFLLIVLALCMGGCGMFQKEQTPEEVFSRAVSGIAGKERLVFEGEAGLRRENSARFENQFKFEGKLEDHDRLTLQTRVPGTIAAAGKESGIAPLDGKPLNGKKGGFSASLRERVENGRHYPLSMNRCADLYPVSIRLPNWRTLIA